MRLRRELSWYGEALLRLFYPSRCASCNGLLALEERGLCEVCLGSLRPLKLEPSEEKIRLTFSSESEGWALFRYEGLVKEVLRKVKFEGRRDLLGVFYPEMDRFVSRRTQLASYECILPIPLDPRRHLEREFNQSGLLAKKIHSLLGGTPRLLKRTLARRRSPLPQSLLGREARRSNVDHAFRVLDGRSVRNRSILLVDDIVTTGATLDEVSKMLKAAGASRVGYLTLARTMAN